MKNIIEISVDKSITGLAGYDFGKKIYSEQVKDKIDLTKSITFVFPESIQRMASSFIQGFFEDIVDQIGILGIKNQVNIQSSNEKMKQIIIDNLL